MSDCLRFGKFWNGCRYEARYDIGKPTWVPEEVSGTAAGVAVVMESSRPKTYVRDVCIRCGRTVERKSP